MTDPVLRLLTQRAATSIVIGSSRDDHSLARAEELAKAWESAGGEVLDIVDWPEQAASWLRQARRFAAGAPDAWVVIASPTGWHHLTRRLAQTSWDPGRTILVDPLQPDQLAGVVAGEVQ
ncbi:hypothetical protein [Kribbella sp. NPDC051718]|uniref:hypothetical protein n=1 Tax=Kribbella sp. NPDC051718 TaxID=3155168 RepID=UPI003420298A